MLGGYLKQGRLLPLDQLLSDLLKDAKMLLKIKSHDIKFLLFLFLGLALFLCVGGLGAQEGLVEEEVDDIVNAVTQVNRIVF